MITMLLVTITKCATIDNTALLSDESACGTLSIQGESFE